MIKKHINQEGNINKKNSLQATLNWLETQSKPVIQIVSTIITKTEVNQTKPLSLKEFDMEKDLLNKSLSK